MATQPTRAGGYPDAFPGTVRPEVSARRLAGGFAARSRRLGDTDRLFEAVPPGEATLLAQVPGHPLEVVTVDDRGTTRRHRRQPAEAR